MGLLKKMKEKVSKAEENLGQVKKDVVETTNKMQTVLDESSKSVQILVTAGTIAIIVGVIANAISIMANLSKHKRNQMPTIVIQRLYLGGPEK